MSVASSRLAEERKSWRKDHPLGFVAKPKTKADGTVDFFHWKCEVPGKDGTVWEGGVYPIDIKFPQNFPTEAPLCYFPVGFTHPNVFENGQVCLSLIGQSWKPSITVKQILLGLQELLDNPNNLDPANWDVHMLYDKHFDKYKLIARQQATIYARKD